MGLSRTYAYDAVGNLTSRTDRNGRTVTYGYDNQDRRTSETWAGSTYVANYTYDLADQLTQAADAVATYAYGYDGLGRATTMIQTLTSCSAPPTRCRGPLSMTMMPSAGSSANRDPPPVPAAPPADIQLRLRRRGNLRITADSRRNFTEALYDERDRLIASSEEKEPDAVVCALTPSLQFPQCILATWLDVPAHGH